MLYQIKIPQALVLLTMLRKVFNKKSVWAFPSVDFSIGIQIEYIPICKRILNSNMNKQVEQFTDLAYFNYRGLEILLQDINSSYIHFIQGDLSLGCGRYYKTFFAFPSKEEILISFRNISPLLYQTGIPCQLAKDSMTYIKSYDPLLFTEVV